MEEFDDVSEKDMKDMLKFLDTMTDIENEDVNYDLIMETLGLDISELEQEMNDYVPQIDLEYRKSNLNSVDPKYAYESDSGFDLHSTEDIWIHGFDRKLIPTGLHFNIPEGHEIQVRSKSGLALKQGLMVLNSPGTVDCFSENMKILTIDGEKLINEIKIGENIFSFNEDTLEIEKDTIKQIYDTEIQEVLIIETDEGNLEVTPNTEIYTSKGIILAKNLTENDQIIVFF